MSLFHKRYQEVRSPIRFEGYDGGGGGYSPPESGINESLGKKATQSRKDHGTLAFGVLLFGKRHADMSAIFNDRIRLEALNDRTEDVLELFVVCDQHEWKSRSRFSPISYTEWKSLKKEFQVEETEFPVLIFYDVKDAVITDMMSITFTKDDVLETYGQLRDCISAVVDSLQQVSAKERAIDYHTVFDIHVRQTIGSLRFMKNATRAISHIPFGELVSWVVPDSSK